VEVNLAGFALELNQYLTLKLSFCQCSAAHCWSVQASSQCKLIPLQTVWSQM